MELLKHLTTFLSENEKWITLSVNVLLGISTLVLTIVNLSLVRRQNEISEELSVLESDRDQPHFRISLTYEKDDDGSYGTDILSVVNVGNHTLEPCVIDAEMFFQLTKSKVGKQDVVYAFVGDYYSLSHGGNVGDEEVFYARTEGNNRKFYELYLEALNDRNEKETYYSIDKVLLLKICYTDIHNKKHERYYRFSREIDKEEYYSIYSKGSTIEHSFTLADISYPKLKKILSDVTSK